MEFEALVTSAQSGDNEAMLELIRRFNPLLRKYAKILASEDAYSDLLCDFIEMIRKLKISRLRNKADGVFVTYIGVAMKHSYLRRRKALTHVVSTLAFSDLSEAEVDLYEEVNLGLDKYFDDEIPRVKAMTDKEADVLRMLYIQGKSVGSVASEKNFSRQAVSRTKKSALDKLKRLYAAA